MTNVSIALCFNDRYCSLAAAAITSIINHTSKSNNYEIYIFHSDISEENQGLIMELNDKDNISLEFLKIDFDAMSGIENLYTWTYLSKDVYTRLFLHRLLPAVEKLLFLDVDIIVNGDIAQLYDTNLGDKSIGVCRDQHLWFDDVELAKKEPITNPDFAHFDNRYNYYRKYLKLTDTEITSYFNAGVILLNLKKYGKIIDEWMPRLAGIKFYLLDQDMLNMIFKNDRYDLDPKYNVFAENVFDYILQNKNMPFIIHYAGPSKPTQDYLRPIDNLYWQTVSNTKFYYQAINNLIGNKIDLAYLNNLDNLYYDLRRIKKIKRKQKVIRMFIWFITDKKRYRKLKRRPEQFFADSRNNIIKFLGKFYN